MMKYSFKIVFGVLFFFLGGACFGQQLQLREEVQRIRTDMETGGKLMVQYQMTLQEVADTHQRETVMVTVKQVADRYEMKVGEVQLTLLDKQDFVVVNHLSKIIQSGKDTLGTLSKNQLFDMLIVMVDSAINVVETKTKNTVSYTMDYANMEYDHIKITFDKKTKGIKTLHVDYDTDFSKEVMSLDIVYTLWDKKWKVPAGFPFLHDYVVKKGDKMVLAEKVKDYKLFEPEYGKLSLD